MCSRCMIFGEHARSPPELDAVRDAAFFQPRLLSLLSNSMCMN